MDILALKIKTEEALDIEDGIENYLKHDFEIGIKVENDSPVFQDWCLQNTEYHESIACEVKEECDVHTCFICLRMFEDSYSLYKHNITHLAVVMKSRRMYQCDHCLSYFTSKNKIIKHIQTKHFLLYLKRDGNVTKQNHVCLICNKVFTYKRLHEHMNDSHPTEKLRCVVCNVAFKCYKYLRRHVLHVHENVRPSWRFHTVKGKAMEDIKCELCPSVLANKNAYKTHIRNCHSGGINECHICHSKLKSNSYLLTHMRRVHYNDGKIHKCNICFKVFRSPRYLNVHKRNTHKLKVNSKKAVRNKVYDVD